MVNECDCLPVVLGFLKQADGEGIDEFVRKNHGPAIANIQGLMDCGVVGSAVSKGVFLVREQGG